MPKTERIKLLDRLGYHVEDIDVPEPLPVVVFFADHAYIRVALKSLKYRRVSSYVSPDTSTRAFKTGS